MRSCLRKRLNQTWTKKGGAKEEGEKGEEKARTGTDARRTKTTGTLSLRAVVWRMEAAGGEKGGVDLWPRKVKNWEGGSVVLVHAAASAGHYSPSCPERARKKTTTTTYLVNAFSDAFFPLSLMRIAETAGR